MQPELHHAGSSPVCPLHGAVRARGDATVRATSQGAPPPEGARMSKLHLTLACLDYDRVKPLMTRAVEPAGIDLNILTYSADHSVWPMIRHQEFDASEMTLASYTVLRARGEAPFTAIP